MLEIALDSGTSMIVVQKAPHHKALETFDDDRCSSSHIISPDLHDLASFRGSALYKLIDIAKLSIASDRTSSTGAGIVSYFCTNPSAFLVPSIYTIREVDMNIQDRIGENARIQDIAFLVVELVENFLDAKSNNIRINVFRRGNLKVFVRLTGTGIACLWLQKTSSTTSRLALAPCLVAATFVFAPGVSTLVPGATNSTLASASVTTGHCVSGPLGPGDPASILGPQRGVGPCLDHWPSEGSYHHWLRSDPHDLS